MLGRSAVEPGVCRRSPAEVPREMTVIDELGVGGGPLGSHGRNWAPAEAIADYPGNCREGLETWSERRAADLLGCERIELYRRKRMAELPDDLFEALLTSGSKPPSSRELANIARALAGCDATETERCPHCGALLRVGKVCGAEHAAIVNKWPSTRRP
jgi:hypothetical protein